MFRKSADFKVTISGIRNALSFEWEDMSDEEIEGVFSKVVGEEIQYSNPLDISVMEIEVSGITDGYRYTEAFDHETMSHLQPEKLLDVTGIQKYVDVRHLSLNSLGGDEDA